MMKHVVSYEHKDVSDKLEIREHCIKTSMENESHIHHERKINKFFSKKPKIRLLDITHLERDGSWETWITYE